MNCGRPVYLAERVQVESKVYHRSCFRCNQCNIMLRPGAHEYDRKNGLFYCKFHYTTMKRTQMIEQTAKERGISNEVLYGPLGGKSKSPSPSQPYSSKETSPPQKLRHMDKEASPPQKLRHMDKEASPPQKLRHMDKEILPPQKVLGEGKGSSPPRIHQKAPVPKNHPSSKQADSEYTEPPPVYAAVNKVPNLPPKSQPSKSHVSDKIKLADALDKAAAKKTDEQQNQTPQPTNTLPPNISDGLLTGHYEMSDDVQAILDTLPHPSGVNSNLKLEDFPYGHYEVDKEHMKDIGSKPEAVQDNEYIVPEFEEEDEVSTKPSVPKDKQPMNVGTEHSVGQPPRPKQLVSVSRKTSEGEVAPRKEHRRPPPLPAGAPVKPAPRRPPPPLPPGRRPGQKEQGKQRRRKRKKSKSLEEIDQELQSISELQQELENKGVALEMEIRSNMDSKLCPATSCMHTHMYLLHLVDVPKSQKHIVRTYVPVYSLL